LFLDPIRFCSALEEREKARNLFKVHFLGKEGMSKHWLWKAYRRLWYGSSPLQRQNKEWGRVHRYCIWHLCFRLLSLNPHSRDVLMERNPNKRQRTRQNRLSLHPSLAQFSNRQRSLPWNLRTRKPDWLAIFVWVFWSE
jgi:hypothetical protein